MSCTFFNTGHMVVENKTTHKNHTVPSVANNRDTDKEDHINELYIAIIWHIWW
jgi:hypothetical protein